MRVSQYTGEPRDAVRVLPHILSRKRGDPAALERGGGARVLTPSSPLFSFLRRDVPPRRHFVTGIGVLIRQGWQCRACDAPIRLSTAWYQNTIPLTDPYWERSKTPLAFRKSPLRAYCRTCRPEGSRLRRTSLTKRLPTVADLKPLADNLETPVANLGKHGDGHSTRSPRGSPRDSGPTEDVV